MRTSNPVLSDNAFDVPGWEYLAGKDAASTSMTIQGTVNAAFMPLCAACAVLTFARTAIIMPT
ncbi:MAG: hypothetical protein JNK70_09650 [Phycisphaerae bacterium]|nr:hypothetical protein [Phycisphaerae bacterium]